MHWAQPPFNDLRLGRYPSIVLSLLALIIFGFGTAFVSSFHQYLFFRFGVSQALVGYSISSVSLGEEVRPHGESRVGQGVWGQDWTSGDGARSTGVGCMGVGGGGGMGAFTGSQEGRIVAQMRRPWRKEPPPRLPGGCRLPFHLHPPCYLPPTPHSLLSYPLTPSTRLTFIEL